MQVITTITGIPPYVGRCSRIALHIKEVIMMFKRSLSDRADNVREAAGEHRFILKEIVDKITDKMPELSEDIVQKFVVSHVNFDLPVGGAGGGVTSDELEYLISEIHVTNTNGSYMSIVSQYPCSNYWDIMSTCAHYINSVKRLQGNNISDNVDFLIKEFPESYISSTLLVTQSLTAALCGNVINKCCQLCTMVGVFLD